MALTFELLKWQKEVLADKTRFKVVCAGRRCGKSRLAATELLIYGLKCPDGSAVMYVAPTQGQARVIIWDVLMNLGREVIASSHVNNMEITLVNGIRIYIRGADRPDTLRGVSLSFVVLDEYADMKPIGTAVGNKQRMQEFKERLLHAPVGESIIRKVLEVALDDEHPGQMSAMKMCLDRMLPVAMFEEKKDGVRTAIQINITGIGEAVAESKDINDAEVIS